MSQCISRDLMMALFFACRRRLAQRCCVGTDNCARGAHWHWLPDQPTSGSQMQLKPQLEAPAAQPRPVPGDMARHAPFVVQVVLPVVLVWHASA